MMQKFYLPAPLVPKKKYDEGNGLEKPYLFLDDTLTT